MSTIGMWGVTDTGRQRGHNEDAVAWDEADRFAVLADGMGGHNAGEVASAMVIETVVTMLREAGGGDMRRLLRRAVAEANRRVHAAAQGDPQLQGMGSTVVAARFTPRRLVVAHVGDSRLYRLREGRLQPLTADHSLVQEMVQGGLLTPEQARVSPHRNVITRAIGTEPAVAVEVASFDSRRGDRVLLCSDGLSDMVDETRIAALLQQHEAPEAACRELVAQANEAGGSDNISVIVADVR